MLGLLVALLGLPNRSPFTFHRHAIERLQQGSKTISGALKAQVLDFEKYIGDQ